MELYIDTSNSEKIIVGLDEWLVESPSKQEKAQKLLSVINEVLKKKKAKLTDLTAIKVNIGPGSFTGLRVGVSVANALGWALGIPVNGQDVSKKPVEPKYQ